MKQYIQYLKYVLRHKWYVMEACFNEGLYWQGIVHDLSKFRPSEFIPYARHFHNPDGSKKQVRGKTGYYKPTDTGDSDFDFAWFLHQKRNRHHWQYWMIPTDDGNMVALPMQYRYVIEMVCDWAGAGKAQGFVSPKENKLLETRAWYAKNKDKMVLHHTTRKLVEAIIGV